MSPRPQSARSCPYREVQIRAVSAGQGRVPQIETHRRAIAETSVDNHYRGIGRHFGDNPFVTALSQHLYGRCVKFFSSRIPSRLRSEDLEIGVRECRNNPIVYGSLHHGLALLCDVSICPDLHFFVRGHSHGVREVDVVLFLIDSDKSFDSDWSGRLWVVCEPSR